MKNRPRILISGGGTGGHIFPALAIADACRRRFDAEILFVGAEGRMEMERVPAAGYPIKALPVAGFNRKNIFKNFSVVMKLLRSMRLAKKILKEFNPDLAVGVGGYASGPMLKAAQKKGIPTLLQEQNSFAGVTNRLLASKAAKICVAYTDMERYFPKEKIVMTGNPVRKTLLESGMSPAEARKAFGLKPDLPTVLVVGGSLGALTLNESMEAAVKPLTEKGIQVIWQTGKSFLPKAEKAVEGLEGAVALPFIPDMNAAYAAATLVVARAGAGTISELELLGKAAVLVPSPNVAEDHQTKNALALSSRDAAVLVPDKECREKLLPTVTELISDPSRLEKMRGAILKLALPDSDEKIADEIAQIL
ncbi:MAG: undecaprenyldiphospho-muramoylpentapeptide beta-N-acetylglucosaminyltransferase [Muribaculaceae bacterium]|nr:undecaprenyldiphospho-muramoylpentapeptide beta-N-acetylglucosaminyltransferase [Muribaculaceae bacterium]